MKVGQGVVPVYGVHVVNRFMLGARPPSRTVEAQKGIEAEELEVTDAMEGTEVKGERSNRSRGASAECSQRRGELHVPQEAQRGREPIYSCDWLSLEWQ